MASAYLARGLAGFPGVGHARNIAGDQGRETPLGRTDAKNTPAASHTSGSRRAPLSQPHATVSCRPETRKSRAEPWGRGWGKAAYPVDDHELAADVLARSAREEDDRACEVDGLAPAPSRDALGDLAQPDGVG